MLVSVMMIVASWNIHMTLGVDLQRMLQEISNKRTVFCGISSYMLNMRRVFEVV